MNSQVAIRRSRGAVTGAILLLLGLWGGLAPFIGPYLHFGYTPDTAWAYSTGRLYYSVLPGAAALAGGLLVIVTRSRAIAIIGGLLAALGGLWFVIGSGVTFYLLKQTSVSIGTPLGASAGSTAYTSKEYLEVLALYTAIGAAIIFCGALACGRMSMISARDAAAAEADDVYQTPDYAASALPDASQYEDPAATGSFPTAAGQFPSASGQFTRPSTFPPGNAPFDDAPRPLSPEEPGQ